MKWRKLPECGTNATIPSGWNPYPASAVVPWAHLSLPDGTYSLYGTIAYLLSVGKDMLDRHLGILNSLQFKEIELDFLSEYFKVLKSITITLDKLQGGKSAATYR